MAINTKRDIVYRTIDGLSLQIDIAWPKTGGPYPAVLLLHGGGWYSGDEDSWRPRAQQIAANEGMVAFAASYRLASPGVPGSHAPAPVDDVLAACQWITANGAAYRADGNRLGAFGFSAGAHLVLELATRGAVKVAVSWSGPSHLPSLPDSLPPGDPPQMTPAEAAENYVGCPLASCPAQWDDASPLLRVTPTTAPLRLVNSASELVPLEQATRMRDALLSAGVPTELQVIPGSSHGGSAYDSLAWGPSMAWLRAYL